MSKNMNKRATKRKSATENSILKFLWNVYLCLIWYDCVMFINKMLKTFCILLVDFGSFHSRFDNVIRMFAILSIDVKRDMIGCLR
jgi:hypothetical protein